MNIKVLLGTTLGIVGVIAASLSFAQQATEQKAAEVTTLKTFIINTHGQTVGEATLTETPKGVLVHATATNIPKGWHGFHIHETGVCTPPDFKSAGGHFNPHGQEHGYMAEKGFHAGDFPNVYVGPDGKLNIEYLNKKVTLRQGEGSLLDANGSALVIHKAQDDYTSQPAGNAGDRIACAVIK